MIHPKLSPLEPGIVTYLSDTAIKSGGIDLARSYAMGAMPQMLIDFIRKTPDTHFSQAAPMNGLINLREEIARKTARLYGHVYDAEKEISITSGPNQAIHAAMNAFLEEGDEVLLFEPANENYLPMIMLCGARPVFIKLKEPELSIDWDEVTRMVTSNTKMIIINTPHNPTGMIFSDLDMLRLQKVINGTQIVVLSDERYEHITFNNEPHQSVSLYPKLAERSILINSLTETCKVSWPVGYCAGPEKMMEQVRQILHVIDGDHFVPFQMALSECLSNREVYKKLGEYYQQKRDYFNDLLVSKTRFIPIPSSSTCFQLLSYKNISDINDKEFATKLLKDTGVAVVPYSTFFHEKQKTQFIRINFARPKEVLEQAIEKLKSV